MKDEGLIVWLPIVDPLKEGKFGLWWYKTHELVPQKVRTKGLTPNGAEKTFFVNLLAWKHWHKRPLKCLNWNGHWMTHLICFHSSQEVPDLLLSHSSPEVPDLILSHSSQDVPDDSPFLHKKRPICTMLSYSCWVLQELLYRIHCPQIRKVRICSSMCQQIVYRRNVQGKEKGNYNRSLTFLGKKCNLRQPHLPPASLC